MTTICFNLDLTPEVMQEALRKLLTGVKLKRVILMNNKDVTPAEAVPEQGTVRSYNSKERDGVQSIKRYWVPAFVGMTAIVFFMAGSIQATATLGSLTLTRVAPRIITPNGDGANDKARFEFNNPEDLPVSGTIYDLNGARVADLKGGGSDPALLLLWDGKDVDGRTVAGGIYLYQIVFQGKTATGTVIVAR